MQNARTTAGAALDIRYDARTNSITFRELDWFDNPFRQNGDSSSDAPAIMTLPAPVKPARPRRAPKRLVAMRAAAVLSGARR